MARELTGQGMREIETGTLAEFFKYKDALCLDNCCPSLDTNRETVSDSVLRYTRPGPVLLPETDAKGERAAACHARTQFD